MSCREYYAETWRNISNGFCSLLKAGVNKPGGVNDISPAEPVVIFLLFNTLLSKPGVQGVSESFAEEVEGGDGDEDGESGEDGEVPGAVRDIPSTLVENFSPACSGWSYAESQEAQAGFSQDGAGNAEGGADQDGSDGVGQDMPEHDPGRRYALCLGRADIILGPDFQEFASYQPGDSRPSRDADNDHDVVDGPWQESDDGDDEEKSGKAYHDFNDAREEYIDPFSEISCHGADDDADSDVNSNGHDADGQGDDSAVDHPGQDIPSRIVCSQEMI